MDTQETEFCGFLDVKTTGNRCIMRKVRKKSLVTSRVWKRLWCSAKNLGSEFGVQIQFNSGFGRNRSIQNQSEKGNSVTIPLGAVIHRIHSRTKQFAFGISPARDRKPLLTLSANSETETQRWMSNIRHLLKPRRHCCMDKSYSVSMVDNVHSKAAGLMGLYGDLIASEIGITIKDIHTGETVEAFEWKEFGQFHLMTAGRPEDVKRICVMHTTTEFRCSIGELYIFCLDASSLLQDLVTQGRGPKHRLRSLSINDENLESSMRCSNADTTPLRQSNIPLCMSNIEANRTSIHTESIENIYQSEYVNLTCKEKKDPCCYRESDTSTTSGIYEEILENVCSETITFDEDRDKSLRSLQIKPPPLPPRHRPECTEKFSMGHHSYAEISDLERSLQNTEARENTSTDNSNYVSMSPQLGTSIVNSDTTESARENDYVIMR